jgi:hypothetical protein
MQLSEVFWTAFAVLSGIAMWLGTEILSLRRHLKEARSKQWDQIIAWARIIESDEEPELAKALAQSAMQAAGISEEQLDGLRRQRRERLLGALFVPRESLSDEEDKTIRQALTHSPTVISDPDISTMLGVIRGINDRFAAYSQAREAQIRIAIVMTAFAFNFLMLAVFAIRAALFG